MENTKLSQNAVILDRVLKIFHGFALAAVIACAVFIPLTLIFGAAISDVGAVADEAQFKRGVVAELVAGIATAAAVWYCLGILREILTPMKEGKPFAAGISGKIRRLGWASLIGGAVAELGSLVAGLVGMPVTLTAGAENAAAVSHYYRLNPWFIIAALILFFLSRIFSYGEALQRESDETL